MIYETGRRDVSILPHDPLKAIVAPRPIGWISTRSADGQFNVAPYSFFNVFCSKPPILGFSSEGIKDSMVYAQETGEFVANLVTFDLVQAMSETSAPLLRGESEFDQANITMAASHIVTVPRIAQAHAAMECKVTEILTLSNQHGEKLDRYVVFGEVVAFYINEEFIIDGRFDAAAAQIVGRCGYQDYAIVTSLFELARPPGGGDGHYQRSPKPRS